MKNSIFALTISALTLSACAQRAENVAPDYVSRSTYSGFSCSSLTAQRNDIVAQVNSLSEKQDKAATNDAVATGVALVLFWPALIFIGASPKESQKLATMKGHYEAITGEMYAKKCAGATV